LDGEIINNIVTREEIFLLRAGLQPGPDVYDKLVHSLSAIVGAGNLVINRRFKLQA
jgi:hypothetical protein